MAKKTNKTSHVLNLITNGNDSESDDAQAPEASSPAAAGSQPAVKEQTANDNNATEEHAAALRENAAALRESAAALRGASHAEEAEAVLPEPPSVPAGENPSPTEPEKPSEPKDNALKEPAMRPGVPGDKKVIVVDKSSENDKISTEILNNLTSHLEEENVRPEVFNRVNVMEEIVSHIDMEKHMNNYELCMCERCKVDVQALTLTNLPAKYVVIDGGTVAPIIGYYENKYRVRILTEIIKACLVVKESPRHGDLGSVQDVKK